MESFTSRAIEIIKNIPLGKVMTYGQVAKLAGSPRGARQIVRILHSMSQKYHLPWHRVLNAKGEIGIQDEAGFLKQKQLLQKEGIKFTSERTINLKEYQVSLVLEKEDVDLI
ncbi:MGMT family protein [Bacillus sp. AFS041924]|jgi:methylated-DNA-protein-cysteine methyltransferase-like protein|uniref:MGMT family protein n=1 Tax=Bacillus sp. AFS041924 TaxID=2033503 RepID=UPI000BFBFF4B|nr:MGMT family protein [Bacillus sp. AFS041924]PGS55788.1 DNA methyltransferase [Bacillus sp. AFS041924]